jgi:hypothetical protein
MKKIIDTPTVQFTTYDPKCPFDSIMSFMDEMKHIGLTLDSIQRVHPMGFLKQ